MNPVPWMVGLRYSRSRAGNLFLSFLSRVSMIGLVLGVVALTVVVSVMNGFDKQLKYRILGAIPHIVVETRDADSVGKWLDRQPVVKAHATFLRRSAVAIHNDGRRLVNVYGIEPEREKDISIIPDHLVAGAMSDLTAGSHHVILGRSLGFDLGLNRGDVVTLIIPQPSASGNSVTPKMTRATVAGFFEVKSELDYGLVLMNRNDLASAVGDHTQTLRVTLHDVFRAASLAATLAQRSDVLGVSDWTDEYGDFFRTVRMEKIMMFILLTLIVAIAAFNIVSGLSMMVKEKQADIAVFRTMGLSPAQVMQVFVIQGTVVGVLGTAAGMLAGVPLAYYIPGIIRFVENLVGARMLAGTYFDRVPTDVRVPDLVAIVAVSMALSLLATLYPAWRAARLRPARVLRYE